MAVAIVTFSDSINDRRILKSRELLASNTSERFRFLKLLQGSGEELSRAGIRLSQQLCQAGSILEDFVSKLIFIEQVSKIAEVKVPDVSAVWK